MWKKCYKLLDYILIDKKMNITSTLPYSISSKIKENRISIYEIKLNSYKGFIYKKDIAINKKLNFYKKRFTIAHELGHFFDTQEKNEVAPYLSRYKQEKFADNFAMQELLPASELEEKVKIYNWTLEELQSYFWVEKEIIEKRILQLNF